MNTLIAKWKADGIVLPSNAVKGVFTCCGFDNIDWNEKNPLAQLASTLHGTIFVVHQFVDHEQPYQMIEIAAQQKGKTTVQELPEFTQKLTTQSMCWISQNLMLSQFRTRAQQKLVTLVNLTAHSLMSLS